MHLYPGYVRLIGAQFISRSNIFRNSIHVKNIHTSSEGALCKPVHVASRLQHEPQSSACSVLEKNDYITDVIMVPENCFDGKNKITIDDTRNVVTIFKLTPSGYIYENEDFLLTQEFKNVLSSSLFHYDVSVVNCHAIKNKFLVPGLTSITAYQPLIIYYDYSLLALPNYTVMLNETPESPKGATPLNLQGKPSEEKLLNVINHLCDSLLNFFQKPHNFSIFRKDIVFQNNFKGITTRGLPEYKKQMYMLRMYGHLHFSKVKVEILKITHHLEDGTVRIRWRFNGVSRTKIIFQFWKLKLLTWKEFLREESEWIDGFSIFSVDQDGLIYKHFCDKMIPDDDETTAKPGNIKTRILTLLGVSGRQPTVGGVHAMFTCSAFSDNNLKIQEKIK